MFFFNIAAFLRSPVLKKKSQKSLISKKKKKKIQFSYISFLRNAWFYQDFKNEITCFLNLLAVHPAKILDLSLEIMLSPLKSGTKQL